MRVFLFGLIVFCIPFLSEAQTAASDGIDIIIEPYTSVPAFYKGRPEPTSGSLVRALAIPADGTPPDTYIYRWDVEGTLQGNGGMGDAYTTVFNVPFGDQFLLRVDVYDSAGTPVATEQKYVSVSEPLVRFYETSLLRGMSQQAVQDPLVMIEKEISVRAEPFFMDTTLFSGSYDLAWFVDAREVTTGEGDEQVLTLRKNEESGRANIRFTLRNHAALGQSIDDRFTISF